MLAGMLLVSTIAAAFGVGILGGWAVLNLFFLSMSRNRQEAPVARPVALSAHSS